MPNPIINRRLVFSGRGNPYLPLTTAFKNATGITDITILNALNTTEDDLISNNLISKIYAWHPFVGGTATTHKFNFMDARDLDAAYRLQFNGGWVHSSNGALPNGINSFARTYYTPTVSDQDDFSLGYYSRTNVSLTEVEMGSANGVEYCLLEVNTSGFTYGLINQTGTPSYADADSLGMYIASRTGGNVIKNYKNNVLKIANSTGSVAGPYEMIYIGGYNNTNDTGSSLISTKECATSIIADGLNDTESITLSVIINTLQTALGRNVY